MRKFLCLLAIFHFALMPLKAQKDTLVLQPDTGKIIQPPFPGSYHTGKAIAGLAGILDTVSEKSGIKTGDFFFNKTFIAACNRFAIHSWVKVTNPENKKSIVVYVAHRMSTRSKKRGNLIELSKEAIKLMGFHRKSEYKIKVQLVILNDSSFVVTNMNDTIVKKIDSLIRIDSATCYSFKIIGMPVTGIASFYSANLDGTKTATGEIYRNRKLTGASNNLKLNTWVLVTNLNNKKSVIIRINDRMHPRMKKRGRVVDLSGTAAKILDFIDAGLTKVKLEPVQLIFLPIQQKQENDSLQLKQKTDSLPVTDSVRFDSTKTDKKVLVGMAGSYRSNQDGDKTATGEIFRNSKLTAASNYFALNSYVKITNSINNKYVLVRINDRIHSKIQKKNRVVNVSIAAAKRLGLIKNSLTKVKMETVYKEKIE